MHPIWKLSLETIIKLAPRGLSARDREQWLYKTLPQTLLQGMRAYFRLQVEGMEHVPRNGPAIITPNHSGFAGFDALLLSHEIQRETKRHLIMLTHYMWFLSRVTAAPMKKLGFIEATTANGLKALRKKRLVLLFPEGESGNFKPSIKAYRLQEFKRGFVRMALTTGAPIIPTLIIGAEESHINLKQLKLDKLNAIFPLPFNFLPLPAKWKICFLEPVHLPFKPSAANDRELVKEIAADLRERMQISLNQQLESRGNAFW